MGLGLPLAIAAVLLGPKLYPFETLVTLDLLDDFHKRPNSMDFDSEMTKNNKVQFYNSKPIILVVEYYSCVDCNEKRLFIGGSHFIHSSQL